MMMGRMRQWSWHAFFTLTPVDVVVTAIYLGVLFSHGLGTVTPHTPWQIALSIGLVLALLIMHRVETVWSADTTPKHFALFLLIARLAIMGVVLKLDVSSLAWFLFLIPPLRVCLYFGNRAGYAVAGITWLSFFLVHPVGLTDALHGGSKDLILFAMALIFVCTMARALREERESRERSEELLTELTRSHMQLQIYAERATEFATTEERNRLAQDIHDSLGHYLTVANVQIEKAIAFQYRDPLVAEQAMRHAKDTAHDALGAVRQSVSALRISPDAFDFAGAMNALVERSRTDGCEIRLHMEGNETLYHPETLTALYYVTQEGMTNIQKHARATAVFVDLCFGIHEARLTIRDNGVGFDPALHTEPNQGTEGGYGFQSMQTRLARIGGWLRIASMHGVGTTLTISAPRIAANAITVAGMAQRNRVSA